MAQDPSIIGSEVVRWLYVAKHRRRMNMNRFALLVGVVDWVVAMGRLAQDPDRDVLHNSSAKELIADFVETFEDGLPGILDHVAASMLTTRAQFDELTASGDISPTELLMLMRDGLERAFADTAPLS